MPARIAMRRSGSPCGSTGPDLRSALPLTYQWSLTVRPRGAAAPIVDPTSATPGFTPDISGPHVAQLIVHDGYFESEPDTATVSATQAGLLVPVKTGQCCGPNNSYSITIGDPGIHLRE